MGRFLSNYLKLSRSALMLVCGSQLIASSPAMSATTSDVELRRLDCGTVTLPDMNFLNDSFAFEGRSGKVVVSCYLIKHGGRYMLWDAGLPLSRLGRGVTSVGGGRAVLAKSLRDQLHDIGVAPDKVEIVALSHYHSDHSGQASSFPQARLMIGVQDYAVIKGVSPAFNLDRTEFAPWVSGTSTVDPVSGDRDIFGDGKVVMLAMPGHTPGHHSLLVRLASGAVLLTGDLWHQREQIAIDGVPTVNVSRADSLASMDRGLAIACRLGARIIVGHDLSDLDEDPAMRPPSPQPADKCRPPR